MKDRNRNRRKDDNKKKEDLLDWKLDFNNKRLAEQFSTIAGKTTVELSRLTLINTASASLFLPLLEYLCFSGRPFISCHYNVFYAGSLWCILWVPFFFTKHVSNNIDFFASFVFSCYSSLMALGNILYPADNYAYDRINHLGLSMVMGCPIVLLLRTKYWFCFGLLNAIIYFIGNLLQQEPLAVKIGYMLPTVICLIFASFCGYAYEKRSKFDFFRQVLIDIEAAKLHWSAARDASLLQNIFPKNLSDELEKQMEALQQQPSPLTIPPSSSLFLPSPKSSPIIPVVSSSPFSSPFVSSSPLMSSPFVSSPLSPSSSYPSNIPSSPTSNTALLSTTIATTTTATTPATTIATTTTNTVTNSKIIKQDTTLATKIKELSQIEDKPKFFLPSSNSNSNSNSLARSISNSSISNSPRSFSPRPSSNPNSSRANSPISFSPRKNSNSPRRLSPRSSPRKPDWESDDESDLSNFLLFSPRKLVKTRSNPESKRLSIVIPSASAFSISLSPVYTVVTTSQKIFPPNLMLPPVDYQFCQSASNTPRDSTLVSSGTPLINENDSYNNNNYSPKNGENELQSFLNGTVQHTDGSHIALSHSYPSVTVIFADIVGFTTLSSTITPHALVSLLNALFSRFDDIMDRHNLEKVRTVGDAYLCVGNMSIPLANHEQEAISAALEMISAVHSLKDSLSLRVGISSGPLIAGITGATKWNYDIFGKPVADACLQETLAPPNYIAVTETIYDICKDDFNFICENDDEGDLYLIRAKDQEIATIPENPSDNNETYNTFALLAKPQIDDFQKEVLEISTEGIFDYNLTSDVPLGTSCDFETRFGYTREDVELEEKDLSFKTAIVGFKKPEFQKEFRKEFVKMVHDYTITHSLIFAVASLLFLVAFLLIEPEVPNAVVVTFSLSALQLLAYTCFSKYFDYHRFSGYVALYIISTSSFAFCFVAYLFPTDNHLYGALLSSFFLTSFSRAPPMHLLVSNAMLALFISSIAFSFPAFEGHRARFIWAAFCNYTLIIATQMALQKSFQMQFLSQKKIKYDMYHETITLKRAKLLLQNILPEDIIPRLSSKQDNVLAVVDHFECATIMFINLTNLDELTADLDPAHTFEIYNDLFIQFDSATSSCGLEKIKTINTVYMVASGLPKSNPDHADVAIKLATEIFKITKTFSSPFIRSKLSIRIGIASGPAVAGIIGKKKYSYDCWSDTTNTASRMESNGWNGYIQVTPFTYNLLKHKEYFEKRENLFIKGKGHMDTYVLSLLQNSKIL